MSNAGLGLRDSIEGQDVDRPIFDGPRPDRSTGRGEHAPRAPRPRRTDSPSSIQARRGEPAYAARRPSSYDSGRTRIDADGVRTVKIRGQATPPRRRPAVPIARYDQHPDRAAQWALFLGVFMVIVAIVTGAQ